MPDPTTRSIDPIPVGGDSTVARPTLDGAHSHGLVPGGDPKSGLHESALHRVTSREPGSFAVPSGREEDWRFTPLPRIRELLDPLPADGKLVVEVQVAPGTTAANVGRNHELFGSVLMPADRASALAMAAVDSALLVSAGPDTTATVPTMLTMRGEGGAAYGHLIVDVAPQAHAVVVVDHVGTARLSANTEIRIGEGGSLTYVSLQDWVDDAVHLEGQAAQIGRDARLKHVVVTFGGDLVRMTPTVRYAGPGGEAELLGLYFTDAGQHQEHRLFVDHSEPNCRSRVTYKGALQGKDAQAVWIGDVLIQPTAIGTDTYELNRNLLLTDDARCHSVPNLEIETGEIKQAGHASASGRFDDLQLFYLMSRGIPAEQARRLVVRGFFAEVIDRIGVPTIAERLTRAVDDELAQVGE